MRVRSKRLLLLLGFLAASLFALYYLHEGNPSLADVNSVLAEGISFPEIQTEVFLKSARLPWIWADEKPDLAFNCLNGSRQLPLLTSTEKFIVFFIDKPIFLSLKPFFRERHFSVVKIPKIDSLTDYKEIAPNLNVFPMIFVSPYAFGFEYLREVGRRHLGMIFTVRFSFKFPGNKKVQLTTLKEEFQRFGCKLEDTGLMPVSFILDNSEDCQAFFKFAEEHPTSNWVLKPDVGFGGEGIAMHDNIHELRIRFGKCDSNEAYVVQQYIPDLLLLNNHKFDVRALVLIASTAPFLLFYHDGYLRVTLKEFSSNLSDVQSHLTNTHMQTRMPNFSLEEHLWTFERFQKYLEVHFPTRRHFVQETLVPTIKRYGRASMALGQRHWQRFAGTSQLLGLDLMITSNFEIKLIEINNYPYYPIPSQSTQDLFHQMVKDQFDLLMAVQQQPEPFMAMKIGDKFRSWELIGSEIEERCRDGTPLNPCTDFV